MTPDLLDEDEPRPVNLYAPDGESACLLTCDHAGWRIPRRLGDLGLDEQQQRRHIAWDIGAEPVSRELSRRLDATLYTQTYSRLVVDCNRPLDAHDLCAAHSEDTPVPGNRELDASRVRERVAAVHEPYHAAIAAELDARATAGRASVLVAVHSFTPLYRGHSRPWHVGLLYNRDDRLASVLHELLADEGDLRVGDNQPYQLSDATDYTVPVHGEQRGIAHIEIEIRQDLVADTRGQQHWAERLERLLRQALPRVLETPDAG